MLPSQGLTQPGVLAVASTPAVHGGGADPPGAGGPELRGEPPHAQQTTVRARIPLMEPAYRGVLGRVDEPGQHFLQSDTRAGARARRGS